MKALKLISNNRWEIGILSGLFLFAAAGLTIGAKATIRSAKVMELKSDISKTTAGAFAVSNVEQCESSTSLSGGRSRVECINIVITAARNLKGEKFAHDVATNLSNWVDRENALD